MVKEERMVVEACYAASRIESAGGHKDGYTRCRVQEQVVVSSGRGAFGLLGVMREAE